MKYQNWRTSLREHPLSWGRSINSTLVILRTSTYEHAIAPDLIVLCPCATVVDGFRYSCYFFADFFS